MGAITGVLHLKVRDDVDSINVNNAEMPRSMNEKGRIWRYDHGWMYIFGRCTILCMVGAMIYKSRTIVNTEPMIIPQCSTCDPCDQHFCTCILIPVNGISSFRNSSPPVVRAGCRTSGSRKSRIWTRWKNISCGLIDLEDFHSEHLAKQHAKQPLCRPRIHQVRKKKVAPASSFLIDVAFLRNVQTVQELFLLSAPFSPSPKEPP